MASSAPPISGTTSNPPPTSNLTQNPQQKKTKPPPAPSRHNKLPRLLGNARIAKRPLLRPPIAPTRSSSSTPKIIYVSASTPFIATVKRVRKYLEEIETRAAGPLTVAHGSKALMQGIRNGINNKNGKTGAENVNGEGGGKRSEEVKIKGTGKAITAAFKQAVYWQGQQGILVTLKTGTVGAVDDVVGKEDGLEVEVEDGGGSRVRKASYLEVGISLV